jgi:hypothetical protein
MKKTKIGLVLLGAIATMGLTPVLADDKSPPPPAQEKPENPSKKFQGKVESLDATAKTLKVDSKLIYISDKTKITKVGKPIKLSQVMAGDEVQGTTHLTFDGKTEALTVKVGKEKEEDKDKPDQPAPKD